MNAPLILTGLILLAVGAGMLRHLIRQRAHPLAYTVPALFCLLCCLGLCLLFFHTP